jgi:hypothetical protein
MPRWGIAMNNFMHKYRHQYRYQYQRTGASAQAAIVRRPHCSPVGQAHFVSGKNDV